MMNDEFGRGKQVLLRDWQLKDLEAFEFWNVGKKRWMEFDAPYYTKPSIEQVQKKVRFYRQKIQGNAWVNPRKSLVIADMKKEELLGNVSWYWQSQETNWMSIGIVIYDEQNWKKGIGVEALRLWVNYLFEEAQEIARLDIRTWSGNVGMMQVAKKLGFKEEARFRKARIVKGQFYDSVGFGLLREEWNNFN